jgi:hypothetical protein
LAPITDPETSSNDRNSKPRNAFIDTNAPG